VQRVGISLSYQLRNCLVVAEGASEITVENALPVADVLSTKWGVEAVGVARFCDLDRRRAFAEDLGDWISGDEMDEKKNQRHHQPDDRQGVENALEEQFQWSALGF
jgi:hypothetical protein